MRLEAPIDSRLSLRGLLHPRSSKEIAHRLPDILLVPYEEVPAGIVDCQLGVWNVAGRVER